MNARFEWELRQHGSRRGGGARRFAPSGGRQGGGAVADRGGAARLLLLAEDERKAAWLAECLGEPGQGAQPVVHPVSSLDEALAALESTPVDLVLFHPSGDTTQLLPALRRLRDGAPDLPIVLISGPGQRCAPRSLVALGVADQLLLHEVHRASLARAVGNVLKRGQLQAKLAAVARRERVREEILGRIAQNASLCDILDALNAALRRETSCLDCGFALDLDGILDERLVWPDGGAAAQLAQAALDDARGHPGVPAACARCGVCLRAIESGGRLLGELLLLADAPLPGEQTLEDYATLGAELVAFAVERLRMAESLRHAQRDLQVLAEQLMLVQETERQRIAGDLHDVIGQSLSVVKFSMEDVQQQLAQGGAEQAAAALGSLVPWVKSALAEVRRMSRELRPASIDDLGILPTLSCFFREFQESCRRVVVESRIAIDEADIPEPLKIVVFRIIQEAFTNVLKHAEATRIQVVLQRVGPTLHFAVTDNGRGFDASRLAQASGTRGLGLSSMRERARGSGGEFVLESAAGVGTRVTVRWQLPKRQG